MENNKYCELRALEKSGIEAGNVGRWIQNLSIADRNQLDEELGLTVYYQKIEESIIKRKSINIENIKEEYINPLLNKGFTRDHIYEGEFGFTKEEILQKAKEERQLDINKKLKDEKDSLDIKIFIDAETKKSRLNTDYFKGMNKGANFWDTYAREKSIIRRNAEKARHYLLMDGISQLGDYINKILKEKNIDKSQQEVDKRISNLKSKLEKKEDKLLQDQKNFYEEEILGGKERINLDTYVEDVIKEIDTELSKPDKEEEEEKEEVEIKIDIEKIPIYDFPNSLGFSSDMVNSISEIGSKQKKKSNQSTSNLVSTLSLVLPSGSSDIIKVSTGLKEQCGNLSEFVKGIVENDQDKVFQFFIDEFYKEGAFVNGGLPPNLLEGTAGKTTYIMAGTGKLFANVATASSRAKFIATQAKKFKTAAKGIAYIAKPIKKALGIKSVIKTAAIAKGTKISGVVAFKKWIIPAVTKSALAWVKVIGGVAIFAFFAVGVSSTVFFAMDVFSGCPSENAKSITKNYLKAIENTGTRSNGLGGLGGFFR